jgi:hypothetical protein
MAKYEPKEAYHKSKKAFKPMGEMGESKKIESAEHSKSAKRMALKKKMSK